MIVCWCCGCLQAENPTPSSIGLDDDSVIDRMTQELQAATKGLPAGFKLQPVQFEKVDPLCGPTVVLTACLRVDSVHSLSSPHGRLHMGML